eukprot:tig00001327_g8255.t1
MSSPMTESQMRQFAGEENVERVKAGIRQTQDAGARIKESAFATARRAGDLATDVAQTAA